jgi:hypothetical protein
MLNLRYATHSNQSVKDLLEILEFAIDERVYSHRTLIYVRHNFSTMIQDITDRLLPEIFPQRFDRAVMGECHVELIAKNVRHIELAL